MVDVLIETSQVKNAKTQADRLRLIIEDQRMSNRQMAEALSKYAKINKEKVANMRLGRVQISDDVALAISKKFNINPWWLKTGEGSVYVENVKNATSMRIAEPGGRPAFETVEFGSFEEWQAWQAKNQPPPAVPKGEMEEATATLKQLIELHKADPDLVTKKDIERAKEAVLARLQPKPETEKKPKKTNQPKEVNGIPVPKEAAGE